MAKKASAVKHIVANGYPLNMAEILAMQGEDNAAFYAAFENYLKVLKQDGKSVASRIHEAAIVALEHAKAFNNYVICTHVVEAVQSMEAMRHKTLIQWFEKVSPMVWNDTPSGFQFTGTPEKDASDETMWRIEYAKDNPYYKKAEVVQQPPFNLEMLKASLEKAIKRASSDKASPEQQAELRMFAKKLSEVLPAIDSAIVKHIDIE